MVKVFLIELDRHLTPTEFSKLLNYISLDKKNRILKFHHFIDAERCLLADLLARYVICDNTNMKNFQLQFNKNSYGKPFLLFPSDIYFNTSHSGTWIACALSSSNVGIDVEEIKDIDINIAKDFFSEVESQDLLNHFPSSQQDYFFKLWTLKESYIKFKGKGLSIPLDSFSIQFEKDTIFVIDENKETSCRFFQKILYDKTILSVCYLKKEISHPLVFSVEDFLNRVEKIL